MVDKVKIKDSANLERDLGSHAVVNTSITALENAKKAKKSRMKTENRINILENKLDKIIELLGNANNN